MKVALIETRGEKFAVNKDLAGTFGTSTDTGTGIFSKILNKVKRKGVRVPVLYMGYMYSIFKNEGHYVKFFDSIPDEEFDLVIMASSTVDYENEIALAKRIKSTTKSKVGFIGAFATTNPDLFLEFCDFIISGEPEEATQRIAKGETEPKGIIISKLLNTLDELPFPNWDDHKIKEFSYYPHLKKKPFFQILSSRGCPYDCNYCPYMVLETPAWRKRSPKNVVDEMKYLIKNYGMKSFLFRDPVFTLDKKRTKEICEEMLQRKLKLEWVCETRIDTLDESLLDLMAKSGCKGMNIGVEGFDLELLKNMNRKPPSHELQERLVDYAEKIGIKIMAFYVLGIPGQTKDDIEKTIQYAKHLNSSLAQFTLATPYPGTKFHDEVKNEIIDDSNWNKYTAFTSLIKLENISSEELLEYKEKAFKDYYLRWDWIKKRSSKVLL
jgi:anaerobic magnesium-protoporphyrin IX monomethyl ester cyclase